MKKNKQQISFKGIEMNLNESMRKTVSKYYHARMELVELISISSKNRKVYDNSINKLIDKKKLDEHQKQQLSKDLKAKALEIEKVNVFKSKQNEIFKECFEIIPNSLLTAFESKATSLETFRKELDGFFTYYGIELSDSLFNTINQFGIASAGNSSRIANKHIRIENSYRFSTFLFDIILQIALDNDLIEKINIDYVKTLKAESLHSLDNWLKEVNEIKKPKNLTEYKKVFKELGIKTPKETNKQGYAKAYAKYVRTINAVLVD